MQTLINFKGHPRGPTSEYHDEWEVGYFTHDPWGLELHEPVLGVRCRIMEECGEFTEWSTWMMTEGSGLSNAIETEKDERHLEAIKTLAGETDAAAT